MDDSHIDTSTNANLRLLLVRGAQLWHWDDDSLDSDNGNQMPHPSHRSGRLLPEPRDIEVDESGRIKVLPNSLANKPGEASKYSAEIDGSGLALLPGLIDAHIHMALTGESLAFLDLSTCNSIENLTEAVAGHVAKHPDQSWIIGVNWDQVAKYCDIAFIRLCLSSAMF